MASALLHAWMCPFNDLLTIKGDHQLVGVDLDPEILFGTAMTPLAISEQWGAKSRQVQTVTKFCKRVITQCTHNQIADRIDHLLMLPTFTADHYKELKQIDTKITQILLKVDQQCCPKTDAPWSLALNQAYLRHWYWSIAFSAKCNQHNMKDVLQALQARMHPSTEDQLELMQSLSANLRHAQKNVKRENQEADTLRKCHLKSLLNEAIASNKQKKSKALKHLIQAECNKCCYAAFRQHIAKTKVEWWTFLCHKTSNSQIPTDYNSQ